jgi:uncharacterized protein YcgI (DUF1989 family)
MNATGDTDRHVVLDEIVPAGRPWGYVVRGGGALRLVDLEGRQAVDFLCFDTANPADATE